MPGALLHFGAMVTCTHAGVATPTAPNPRVLVSGQPTVTLPPPYAIAGCSLTPSGSPCLTGTWTLGSTRVTSNGQPLLLMDSQALCAPTGTPVIISVTQTRVIAQ